MTQTDIDPDLTRRQLEALRRQIDRLHRQEAALLAQIAQTRPMRAGWPMQRLAQAMGERISTSSPSRIAV